MEYKKIPERLYEAATAVIGSVMLDPSVSGDVFARVQPQDFLVPEYRTLFEAERQLFLSGKAIDPVAVAAIVGNEYRPLIMQVMDVTPTAANCMAYVDILRQETRLHRLRTLGEQLTAAETLDRFRDRLPAELLALWREHGFGNYGDGLIKVIDPAANPAVMLGKALPAASYKRNL